MGNSGSFLTTCASNVSCTQIYSICTSVLYVFLNKVMQNAAARLGKGTQNDRESNEFIDRKVASSNALFSQRTGNNKNTENNSLEHNTCAL
jgi:hypothetical protein